MLHVFNNTEGKINVIFNRFVLNKTVSGFLCHPVSLDFFFWNRKKQFKLYKVMIKTNKVFQVKISYNISKRLTCSFYLFEHWAKFNLP